MGRGQSRRGTVRRAPSVSASLFRLVSVVAQDPAVRVANGRKILMAQIPIPVEETAPGPTGYRIQVVDYDASTGRYAGAHRLPGLDAPEPPAWRRGDPSIVRDPVFRAHNAYAIAMRTLARFEFALGRRVGWGSATGNHQLKLAPAGMVDANAFYSKQDEGLVFGYFRGAGGKDVYLGLSHDVVAHETAHALLDGLRSRYMYPSTPDQAAFHEGFADIVALLSVFAQREMVRMLLVPVAGHRDAIALADVKLERLREGALFRLADTMGGEVSGVRGEPLRASATLEPDRKLLERAEFQEPHRRGEVLVAAVLRAFLSAWVARIHRAAAKGQDRVSLVQLADEGADVADSLVTLWIRALDYLPPSDVSFADALSAALTADLETRPDDARFRLRDHLRAQFAAFGITPASASGGAEPGTWAPAPAGLNYERVRFESMRSDRDEVFRFLWDNRVRLRLRDDAYTEVLSVCPCVRVGPDGFTLRETVATYYQVARLTADEVAERGIRIPAGLRKLLGGGRRRAVAEDVDDDDERTIAIYGGGTLVFDEFGRLKYHVRRAADDARSGNEAQATRLRHLWESGRLRLDRTNGVGTARIDLAGMHRMHVLGEFDARGEAW